MTFTCATFEEANALADKLRAIHTGLDYVVRVTRPLFDGDGYRVTVGV